MVNIEEEPSPEVVKSCLMIALLGIGAFIISKLYSVANAKTVKFNASSINSIICVLMTTNYTVT